MRKKIIVENNHVSSTQTNLKLSAQCWRWETVGRCRIPKEIQKKKNKNKNEHEREKKKSVLKVHFK